MGKEQADKRAYILGILVLQITAAVLPGSGRVAEARSAAVAEPGFATCAAYYFLAARGHGVQDYDRLYRAGEFSLNEATRRRGQQAATAKMEQASSRFMQQIHQDWRQIALLDRDYETPCARLLEAAGHVGK